MGMYDTLGSGDQVKLFSRPFFSKVLFFSGGDLRYFNEGDPVPYKTWWYNYSENFIAVDALMPEFLNDTSEYYVHVFRNGCYIKTYNKGLKGFSSQIGSRVFTKDGTEYNVKPDRESLIAFIKAIKDFDVKAKSISNRNSRAFNKFLEYLDYNRTEDNPEERIQIEKELREETIRLKSLLDEKREEILGSYIMRDLDPVYTIGGYLQCLNANSSQSNRADIIASLKRLLEATNIQKEDYLRILEISSEDAVVIDKLLADCGIVWV